MAQVLYNCFEILILQYFAALNLLFPNERWRYICDCVSKLQFWFGAEDDNKLRLVNKWEKGAFVLSTMEPLKVHVSAMFDTIDRHKLAFPKLHY